MFEDTYRMIKSPSMAVFKDRNSRFIAHAYPVKTEQEINEIRANLRKQYYDARHHCYAWVLGSDKAAWRVNDDGEPSGSAGRPIHGQIQSLDLTNVLIVVIRYFGGTKLGIPGLINAYRTAAKEALSNAEICEYTINEIFTVSFAYQQMNDIMKIIKEENLSIVNQESAEECRIEFSVRRNNSMRVEERIKKTGITPVFIRSI